MAASDIASDNQDFENLLAERDRLKQEVAHQEENKNQAYLERNHLVAILARIYPSGIRETDIEGWDPEWNGCVYIDLPTGQISYHYHSSQKDLFSDLPPYTKPYDGHSKDDVHNRLNGLWGHTRRLDADYLLKWVEDRRAKVDTNTFSPLQEKEKIGGLNELNAFEGVIRRKTTA